MSRSKTKPYRSIRVGREGVYSGSICGECSGSGKDQISIFRLRALEPPCGSKDDELRAGIASMLALRLLEELFHGLAEGGMQRLYILGSNFAALLLLHYDGRADLWNTGNTGIYNS